MSIVNQEFNHIFIHNPKAAGSWMEKKSYIGGTSHQSIFGYQKEGIDIDSFYKWMFVRNPYDRLVSSFFYSRRTLGRKNVSMRNHFWMLESFPRYIKNLDELFDFTSGNFDINDKNFVNVHIVPQHKFASINQELRLDWVGKVENIEKDWKLLSSALGQSSPVEKTNQSRRSSNWFNYYNAELFDIVNRKYKHDFEMFGYPRYEVF